MSQEKKPVVAITIGDPAGIGPEITVATMMDKSVYDECQPFLIGSIPIVARAMKIMGCDFALNKITHPEEALYRWKPAITIATALNGEKCSSWREKCR